MSIQPIDSQANYAHQIESEDDRQFATTLSRGLRVLACFTASEPLLTNKDISERTDLARPTVSRLTYTLARLGYLRFDPGLGKYGKYRLGSALLSLAHPLLANVHIRQVARLPMKELADRARGWVSMGVQDRLNMVYIETARSVEAGAVTPDVGQTFPIVVSAMGRAYLAALPARERTGLLNQIQVKSPELWHKHAQQVEQGLRDYVEHGFCLGRGDYHPRTHTVAVPMRCMREHDIIVLNCATQTDKLAPGALENDLGPRLVRLARSIEGAMDTDL